MFFNITLIVLGFFSIIYDFVLIILNPGNFLDILTSFTHIWLLLGGYLIFLGFYRIKTKHSFYSIWKKWIKISFLTAFSLIFLICCINLGIIMSCKTYNKQEFEADYLILLGGGISKDGILPKTVKNRVLVAEEYLRIHPETVCVVTGGTLKWINCPEAPAIKALLKEQGINENRILIEDKALDTIQNFIYSAQLLAEYNNCSVEEILNSNVIIVSNFFHLKRAEILAERLGYKSYKTYKAQTPMIYVPHCYVREICAYVKLAIRIFFTKEPKSLV